MVSWTRYWKEIEGNYLGFVDNSNGDVEALRDKVLEAFYKETKSSFVKTSGTTSQESLKNKNILFQSNFVGKCVSFGGIPFVILGTRYLGCLYGKKRSMKASETFESDHASYSATSKCTRTKKIGCPAIITLKDITLFPSMKCDVATKCERRHASAKLRQLIFEGKPLDTLKAIMISLPMNHMLHAAGEALRMRAKLDERVKQKMKEMVSENVASVEFHLYQIRNFVKSLFAGGELPDYNDRRYYPSRYDIRQYVYREMKKASGRLTNLELVSKKLCEASREGDRSFFRKPGESGLLLVFQTSNQKHLLQRYGNYNCFLDSTYKTMKYELFLLCVETNISHCVVAFFFVGNESSSTIYEGLSKIKEWNPQWFPEAFIMDGSEMEQKAVKKLFPECFLYLCEFHRKQSWLRWTSAYKNGAVAHQKDILSHLNSISSSLNENEFLENVSALKICDFYVKNKKLQNYVERQWLKDDLIQSWVIAFWPTNKTPSTYNGMETAGRVLKRQYLNKLSSKSMVSILTTILESFLPDQWRRYVSENMAMCSSRRDSSNNPPSLQHRPPKLLKHLRNEKDKTMLGSRQYQHDKFIVKSGGINEYVVDLTIPFCECHRFRKSGMVCKHILAVMENHHGGFNWDLLPSNYKNHPLFVIDEVCTGICQNQRQVSSHTDQSEAPNKNHNNTCLKNKASRLREMLQYVQNFSYLVNEAYENVVDETLRSMTIIQANIKRSIPDLNLSESEPKRKRPRIMS